DRVYFSGLTAEYLDHAVEDEAGGDDVGDAVAQRHEDGGKEGRYRFAEIRQLDVLEGRDHEDSHHYQHRRSGRIRNGADEGSQKGRQGEAQRNYDRRQAGASAHTDSGRAFYVCRGVGRAEQRTDRGGGSVGKEAAVKSGVKALARFHFPLIFLAEDAAA